MSKPREEMTVEEADAYYARTETDDERRSKEHNLRRAEVKELALAIFAQKIARTKFDESEAYFEYFAEKSFMAAKAFFDEAESHW